MADKQVSDEDLITMDFDEAIKHVMKQVEDDKPDNPPDTPPKDADDSDKPDLTVNDIEWVDDDGKVRKPGKKATKRFNQLYAAAKEGERAKAENETLKQELKLMQDAIKEMAEQQTALTKVLKQGADQTANAAIAQERREKETTLINKITDLRAQIKEAAASDDPDALATLTEQLVDAKLAVRAFREEMKNASISEEDPTKTEPKDPQLDTEALKAIQSFITSTEWIGDANNPTDPLMYDAAVALDVRLSKSPEWQSKPITERLAYVKKTIENRFKYSPETRAPVDGVEGNRQTGYDSSAPATIGDFERSLINLTNSFGFKITEEDYLKSLKEVH